MSATAAATITAGKLAWNLVKALAIAGATEVAANCLQEYYKDIKKLGYKDDYLNNLLKNPESIADTAWEEYEEETLYPTENDENTEENSKYKENYENTLKANEKLTAKAGDFEFTEDQTIGEMLPGSENEEYDKGTGIGLPGTEGTETEVKDETNTNTGVNIIDWISWAEEDRNARWAREDAIRAETQAREDSAYQRAVADARKAGINPNLIEIKPAGSGGGITQASGQNLEGLTSQMNIDADKIMQMIDQAFEGNEAEKDRFISLFGEIIGTFGLIMAFKKGGK